MQQNVNNSIALKANRLIAIDVINERLAVEPTEQNIAWLAACLTELEHAAANKQQGG